MATLGLAGPFIDAFSRIFVIESGLISIATTFFLRFYVAKGN